LGNSKAKLKFQAPIISSVGNLQMFVEKYFRPKMQNLGLRTPPPFWEIQRQN